jgi:hypothetical protein
VLPIPSRSAVATRQAGAEVGIGVGGRDRGGHPLAERDQTGQLLVIGGADVVTAAAVCFVEKLREALGAPAAEDSDTHRRHLPSLFTARVDGRRRWPK